MFNLYFCSSSLKLRPIVDFNAFEFVFDFINFSDAVL